MKLLDWYLGREISLKSLMVGIWLLFVYLFLSLLDELEGGQGRQFISIVGTLIYAIPRMIYELAPIILLIGTILGLAVLSRQSELIAFQAGGVTKDRIVASVVGWSTAFAFGMFLWGELIVPWSETKSEQFERVRQVDPDVDLQGTWHRHLNDFIFVGRTDKLKRVADVSIYRFDVQGSLISWMKAKSGKIIVPLNLVNLQEVTEIQLHDNQLKKRYFASKTYPIGYDELQLAAYDNHSAQLNIVELYRVIQQRKAVGMKTDLDELAFWNRLIIPLSMLVMGMFAVLFCFRMKLRLSTGHFFLLGLLFGLFYFAIQQTVGYVAILSGLTPFVGILAVFLVFLTYASITLYRL